jgi:chemotaxis protein methyltransferase CheR
MEITPQEFRDVQTLVLQLCGLVLPDEKTYLVRTRLGPVIRSHGFSRFGDYLGRVQQLDAGLMRDEFVEALTTRETSFNRDAHPFDEFRRRILPSLADSVCIRQGSLGSNPVARLWSAGCSTGQEPYSIAMAVHDFLASNPARQLRIEQFPILATDICARALGTAATGRYSQHELARGLTAELRNRHFDQRGDAWTAKTYLRRSIDFRRMNLVNPFGQIGPFELIFCRNVLIYFNTPTRQRLCEQFYQVLNPGGLLIIGAAESLYGLDTPLASEQLGATTVYRKPRHN